MYGIFVQIPLPRVSRFQILSRTTQRPCLLFRVLKETRGGVCAVGLIAFVPAAGNVRQAEQPQYSYES
jgi:hypothetical protein